MKSYLDKIHMAIIQSGEKKKTRRTEKKKKVRSVGSTPSLNSQSPTGLCQSKYTGGGVKKMMVRMGKGGMPEAAACPLI